MSRQGLIEVVLDRWVTSMDLAYIRENYGTFYKDPVGHITWASEIVRELEAIHG
mgnify:CR=1 FL=1